MYCLVYKFYRNIAETFTKKVRYSHERRTQTQYSMSILVYSL